MYNNTTDIPVLDLLINSISEPLFVFNGVNEILVWNRACAKLTGLNADEVVGEQLPKIIDSFDAEMFAQLHSVKTFQGQMSINKEQYTFTSEVLEEGTIKVSLKKSNEGVLTS